MPSRRHAALREAARRAYCSECAWRSRPKLRAVLGVKKMLYEQGDKSS
jgi:hypothetical protein